ncbi:hypothetical protein D3C80_1537610 [compost metagenome]
MEAVRKFIESFNSRMLFTGSLAIFSKSLTVSAAALPVASSHLIAAIAISSNESTAMRLEPASCAKTDAALPTVPAAELTSCARSASSPEVVPAALPLVISAVLNAVASSLPCLYARARVAAAAAATVNGLTNPRM